MANTIIDMRKVKKLFRLYTLGISKRSISKQLSLSRNTVRKYIKLLTQSKLTSEELDKLSSEEIELLLGIKEAGESTKDPSIYKLFPAISKELKKVGVTRYMLWEQYRSEDKIMVGYSRFCHLYKVWGQSQNPVMRFEHKAGDKLFVDYTGKKLSVIDLNTGEEKQVEVFVSILGCSGLTYVEACYAQKQEDFLSCLVHALNFYNGVPSAIVPDNLKAAVIKSDKYEPIINENLLAFAEHYDTTILPARSYKPRDKALVENVIKTIYTRVFAPLNREKFYTLRALNQAIARQLILHNSACFQRSRFSRLHLFQTIEQITLKPLPTGDYQIRGYRNVTVQKTAHVYLNQDKHYYSVPYKYVGKRVQIIYTQDTVEIHYKFNRIAHHSRALYSYGGYTTKSEHMAKNHQFIAGWNPDYFINKASSIGDSCKTFIALLLTKRQHPEQSYRSCQGVLQLVSKVGHDRLNNACRRALNYERISYQSVKSILEKGLDRIEEDPKEYSSIPMHKNIRGGKYYK